VLDAAPLIALASAEALDLLPRLGLRLTVVSEVRAEVLGPERHPGAERLRTFLEEGPIEVVRTRSPAVLRRLRGNPRLSAADAASLCAAIETGATLIADDRDLRSAAKLAGVNVGGSLFLLALAVRQGLLRPREAVGVAERMIASGWYCSPTLLKAFAEAVGRDRERG